MNSICPSVLFGSVNRLIACRRRKIANPPLLKKALESGTREMCRDLFVVGNCVA